MSSKSDRSFTFEVFVLGAISCYIVPRYIYRESIVISQVMAWHRYVDKPFPEPMMTQFIGVYTAVHQGCSMLLYPLSDFSFTQ